MLRLKHRFQSFTLVESLISLMIVVSVFFVGTLIMVNVLKTQQGAHNLDIEIALDQVLVSTFCRKPFFDEKISYKEYQIVKQVLPFKDYERMRIIRFMVLDKDDKVLRVKQELIIAE